MHTYFAGGLFQEWYWTPIFFTFRYGLPILAVSLLMFALGYRRIKTQNTLKPSTYFLRIILATTLVFMIFDVAYENYMQNRTGRLNPYTEECIRQGYEGAKGNGCIGTYDPNKDEIYLRRSQQLLDSTN